MNRGGWVAIAATAFAVAGILVIVLSAAQGGW